MGVRDPRYYPKRFCMGVRDSSGCKRPAEIFEISVWVLETRGVSKKFLLPKEDTRACLLLRLRVE